MGKRKVFKPKLIDLYTPEEVRIWVSIPLAYWEVDKVSDDEFGHEPEWFRELLHDSGMSEIIETLRPVDRAPISFFLAHGIAPKQPFQLSIRRPRYYRSGGYEYPYEYDVEFNVDIIGKQPWPLEKVAVALLEEIEAQKSLKVEKVKREEAFRFLSRTRTDCMFVTSEVYFAHGQSTYDDMEMPRGFRYVLCSSATLDGKNNGYCHLVSGGDDGGDVTKALAIFLDHISSELPGLSEEQVKHFPRRQRF